MIELCPKVDTQSISQLLSTAQSPNQITAKDICWECVTVDNQLLLKAVSLLL